MRIRCSLGQCDLRASSHDGSLPYVPIPARLYAGGVLVYTASSAVSSELVVRNGAGKTILTESLGRQRSRSHRNLRGRGRRRVSR
jgi:hypothetical protein